MTQHTLDGSQIGSAFKQVSGKRVTEGMRTYRFVNSGHCGKILDDVKDHDTGQRTSAPDAQEQVRFGSRFDFNVAPVLQIEVYLMDGLAGYGNQTLLAAFSGNADETFIQEQVFHLERAEFRYT